MWWFLLYIIMHIAQKYTPYRYIPPIQWYLISNRVHSYWIYNRAEELFPGDGAAITATSTVDYSCVCGNASSNKPSILSVTDNYSTSFYIVNDVKSK